MPTGALAKKRWKRWRDRPAPASHSRSGVRSRTTERVRRLVADLHHGLADRGIDDAAAARLQDDLAAAMLIWVGRGIEGGMRRRAGRRRSPRGNPAASRLAPTSSAGVAPSHSAKAALTKRKVAGAVDRIEAARRVVEEIGERRPLVADFLLHRLALGDVLEGSRGWSPSSPARRCAETLNQASRSGRMRDRDPAAGAAFPIEIAAQAREIADAALAGDEPALQARRAPARQGPERSARKPHWHRPSARQRRRSDAHSPPSPTPG